MHSSKIFTAFTFIQGSLSLGVLLYSGRDCTGDVQDISLLETYPSCPLVNRYQSYKENGWGPHGQRIAFYSDKSCQSKLYSTWAYDGDYFQSKECYNIDGHSSASSAVGLGTYFQ